MEVGRARMIHPAPSALDLFNTHQRRPYGPRLFHDGPSFLSNSDASFHRVGAPYLDLTVGAITSRPCLTIGRGLTLILSSRSSGRLFSTQPTARKASALGLATTAASQLVE